MAILGVDIGGSGIKSAPVDTVEGVFLEERVRIPTPKPGTPAQILNVIQQIVTHFNWQGAIGVGFPGVVRRGVIETAANISAAWVGVDLAEIILAETGSQSTIINDADAAGIAEMRFGRGRHFDHEAVLVLTLGTGIGSALFLNKALWPNSELGHLQIRGKDAEQRVGMGIRQEKELSWRKWGKRLCEVLRVYDQLLNPDLIVLGGGVSKRFDKFSRYLTGIHAEVLPANLLNQAGIIGAALAAEDNSASKG